MNLCSCANCGGHLSEEELNEGYCSECDYRFNPEQRKWAAIAPELYGRTVNLPSGGSASILTLAEQFVDARIIEVFGVFAVTTEGIDCLSHLYQIDRDQLDSDDWEVHMSEKTWVNMTDFRSAVASCKAKVRSGISI